MKSVKPGTTTFGEMAEPNFLLYLTEIVICNFLSQVLFSATEQPFFPFQVENTDIFPLFFFSTKLVEERS